MEAYFVVVSVICWLPLMWAGILLTRLKRQPWASAAHVLSVFCLLPAMIALMSSLRWDWDHNGWGILVIVPATVIINIIMIWIAGEIWPHCKKCGWKMVVTEIPIKGPDGPGFYYSHRCPKCDPQRLMR